MQSRQILISVSHLPGRRSHDVDFLSGPASRCRRLLLACSLHDVPQRNHVSLQDHHSSLTLFFCRNITFRIPMLGDGLLFHMQFQPESCDLRFRPRPNGAVRHATYDGGRLTDVQVPISFFIDIWGDGSHPENQPQSTGYGNAEVTFPRSEYVPHPNSGPDGFYDSEENSYAQQ